MIKKTDIFKPGNTFAYQKIELVCSYYNLFVGIFLVSFTRIYLKLKYNITITPRIILYHPNALKSCFLI